MMLPSVPLLFSSFLFAFVGCSSPPASPVACKPFDLPCDGANQSCGPRVDCEEFGFPVVQLKSHLYRVKSIDRARQTLVVAGFEFPFDGHVCPYQVFQPELDVSPCGYTERDRLVAVLYDCSAPPPADDASGLHRVTCTPGAAGGPGFYFWAAYGDGRGTSEFERSCTSVSYAVVGWPPLDGARGIWGALQAGFEVTWAPRNLSRPSRCESCASSGGRCIDYSVPSNVGSCRCEDGLMEVCPGLVDDDAERKEAKKLKILLGVVVGGGSLLFVCLLLLCLWYLAKKLNSRVRKTRKDENLEAFMEKFGSLAPKRYCYSDVEKMTSSFSHKLGQGGYGSVYKGQLDDGQLVAVKVLKSSRGSGKDFFNEVISIGSTYHVNIVSLLGFCFEDYSQRILIYEFMPNGSLDKFIFHTDQEKEAANVALSWGKRLEIAAGIARGLAYLHHGCNTGILHFDIKPQNVLLDENFYPKISDFGLAKLCRSAETVVSMLCARGTIGYIAPEVYSRNFGGVSSKSDVYSYGMMLLEMVAGRKNVQGHQGHLHTSSEIYFPDDIYKHVLEVGHLRPFGVTTKEEEEVAQRMILVGMWCIQTKPMDRPSMSRVVDMLEGRVVEVQMPPKPVLSLLP